MRCLLLLLLIVAGVPPLLAAPLAESAWIREAPPTAHARAGYVLLRNTDEAVIRLIGARSEAFGAIEVHESFERDGMMRMRRRQAIEVPAGGETRLQPGGLHLMLFRAQQPLPGGSVVEIVLEFDDGSELAVPFEVRRDAP
jgi:periplasmic copper chaperone A